MNVLKEQLLDLRLRTLPSGTKEKAKLKDYTAISIMLGELYSKKNKLHFNLPEWDFMCERPTIKTTIPYRYALAVTALGLNRRQLRDQGFPCNYDKAYQGLHVEGKVVDLDKRVVTATPTFTTLAIKAKLLTGKYNDIMIDHVFNPFYVWLEYYEKGIILNPENITFMGVEPSIDKEYVQKIKEGYNPELELVMKQPFNIMCDDPRLMKVFRLIYSKDIAAMKSLEPEINALAAKLKEEWESQPLGEDSYDL